MPDPTQPPHQSGGINLGDLTSGRDTNVTLTDVAGRDKNTITNSPGASINYITPAERPPLFFGVPTMPNQFVGRDELMSELIHQLTNGHSLALSAEGLPGVGKTTLAIALAYRKETLTHFRDGVLWAGLGGLSAFWETECNGPSRAATSPAAPFRGGCPLPIRR